MQRKKESKRFRVTCRIFKFNLIMRVSIFEHTPDVADSINNLTGGEMKDRDKNERKDTDKNERKDTDKNERNIKIKTEKKQR